MKTFFFLGLILCFVAPAFVRADNGDEAQLIAVVQSAASSKEKEDASRRLKQIGTARSVPALAALLADGHLYQAACDALETMPFKEAGEALHAALRASSGKAKAAVIHALGERQHRPAISDLGRLTKDTDLLLAAAAARALGEIGGDEAARLLRQALKFPSVRSAAVDGLLRCATQFAAQGERTAARRIFEELNKPTEENHVRTAAYAGLIQVSNDDRALKLVVAGIVGSDSAKQLAALQRARELHQPSATAAFTNLLWKVTPSLQAALLGLLQQRNDASAAPAAAALTRSEDAYVRVCAITALGILGDSQAVSLLARAATSGEEAEQNAGRHALLALRGENVGAILLEQLASASPEVQVELARALAGRAEKSAVARLMELTRSDVENTRRAAFRALNQLADGSHFSQLTKLMEQAGNADARTEIGGVFESITQRSEATRTFDVSPLAHAIERGNPETRVALLQVSALFADAQLRDAFRAALKDRSATIRRAAERVICGTRDVELMPDLLALARTALDLNLGSLALEGYVRLAAGESSDFTPQKRVELLQPAVELASRAEDKKAILSALANVPHQGALELVERLNGDDVRAEAEIAILKISKVLLASAPAAVEKSLEQLAATAQSENVRTNAATALKIMRTPANQR